MRRACSTVHGTGDLLGLAFAVMPRVDIDATLEFRKKASTHVYDPSPRRCHWRPQESNALRTPPRASTVFRAWVKSSPSSKEGRGEARQGQVASYQTVLCVTKPAPHWFPFLGSSAHLRQVHRVGPSQELSPVLQAQGAKRAAQAPARIVQGSKRPARPRGPVA